MGVPIRQLPLVRGCRSTAGRVASNEASAVGLETIVKGEGGSITRPVNPESGPNAGQITTTQR